ncbi:MAG: hypothetical protein H0Z18_08085 [Thermococcus sp.]|uniref:hypothetical protein n=1 Tax=Thermococcus sp. TaxID=35749 RepID=UPI001DB8A767|nr:hypothetical protein [Thermococcus sp.]MBO8175202.1 hypothetical protein [Thermococcus sp.]
MAEVVKGKHSVWETLIRTSWAIVKLIFLLFPLLLVYLVITGRISVGEPYRTIILMSLVFLIGGLVGALLLMIAKIIELLLRH